MQVSYFVLYVSLPCLVGLVAEINKSKSNQTKATRLFGIHMIILLKHHH